MYIAGHFNVPSGFLARRLQLAIARWTRQDSGP